MIHGKRSKYQHYINRSLEEVDSSLGVQDFSGEGNCRCCGNSKRTRSGAGRCDCIAASHEKTLMDEELLLTGEQRNCFFLRWNLLLVKML